MRLALTYDDIQLVPKYSNIKHRKDIKLHTLLSKRYGLLTPLVASPMDTVCEEEMAFKMFLNGGVGCIHRFMSIEEQAKQVYSLKNRIYGDCFGANFEDWGVMLDDWHAEIKEVPIMAAIGVKEEDKKRAKKLVDAGANVLLIDVAHGHHSNVINMIKWCKSNLKDTVDIIAGNIATKEAAYDLEKAGADGLRVGIGGGCFTPDMEVRTTVGNKKIKDIEIGNIVYTHTGEKHDVINKLEFNKNEEIMIINDIECTKNHEFYVVHSRYINKVNDSNIHEYAEWIEAENLTDEYLLIEID